MLETQNVRLSNLERQFEEQRNRGDGNVSVNLGSTFEREDPYKESIANTKDAEQAADVDQVEDAGEGEESDQEEVYLTDAQKYCVEAHCLMHAHGVGQSVDDVVELKDLYEEIRTVNESFARRLKGVENQDTGRNAIAILDSFALMVSFSIDRQRMDDLEAVFAPYLNR